MCCHVDLSLARSNVSSVLSALELALTDPPQFHSRAKLGRIQFRLAPCHVSAIFRPLLPSGVNTSTVGEGLGVQELKLRLDSEKWADVPIPQRRSSERWPFPPLLDGSNPMHPPDLFNHQTSGGVPGVNTSAGLRHDRIHRAFCLPCNRH